MTWQLWFGSSDDVSHLLSYELVYRIFINLSTLPLIWAVSLLYVNQKMIYDIFDKEWGHYLHVDAKIMS